MGDEDLVGGEKREYLSSGILVDPAWKTRRGQTCTQIQLSGEGGA